MEAIFRLSDLNSHDSRGSNSVGEHFALPPLLIFIFSLTPGKKSSVETGRLKVKAAGECQDQEPFLRSINEYICGSLNVIGTVSSYGVVLFRTVALMD